MLLQLECRILLPSKYFSNLLFNQSSSAYPRRVTMDLIFQPNRGNPFCIEVGYFDTVLEIKEKVEKYQGFPVPMQTLIFNGTILKDDIKVHYSDILDCSRIYLKLPPDFVPNPKQVTINDSASPSGINPDNPVVDYSSKIHLLLKMPSPYPAIPIQADADENILTLKGRIQVITGILVRYVALYAKGAELLDDKCLHDFDLPENMEIDVGVRSSEDIVGIDSGVTLSEAPAPAPASQSPATTASLRSSSSRKCTIPVFVKYGGEKIPMFVNYLDSVCKLRKKLEKMKLDLPQQGYFFIYKQDVMEDDQSFRWHHVSQGDTIEVFSGSVSGGS